jgi:putative endonuclease
MKHVLSKRKVGDIGEKIAENFLRQQGYVILERKFYYQHGEIDIVAKDGDALVFIEVKLRRNNTFGLPEESVTPKKQELLRRTAEGYVQINNLENIICRFDVVSISEQDGETRCLLLKDCF